MSRTAVRSTVENGTAWVTLDGPQTRNALDARAASELVAVCEEIDRDQTIGAAVITGVGPAFCSGADTAELDRLRRARPDEAYDGLGALYSAFGRVAELRVPVLAAVNGPAVGAGVNLALAASLRIVSTQARFISGFAKIGIHPGGGHLHLLAATGGAGLAAAAGVFAQPVDAETALRTGLAWRVVPAEELRAVASDMVAHLAADPALARALSASLRRTVIDDAGWDRAIEIERARQMWSLSRPRKES
ncbi:MAG: enoyl-CoA hydratase/isomerase family protein [Jatrophihabitantaceae bacterium]